MPKASVSNPRVDCQPAKLPFPTNYFRGVTQIVGEIPEEVLKQWLRKPNLDRLLEVELVQTPAWLDWPKDSAGPSFHYKLRLDSAEQDEKEVWQIKGKAHLFRQQGEKEIIHFPVEYYDNFEPFQLAYSPPKMMGAFRLEGSVSPLPTLWQTPFINFPYPHRFVQQLPGLVALDKEESIVTVQDIFDRIKKIPCFYKRHQLHLDWMISVWQKYWPEPIIIDPDA